MRLQCFRWKIFLLLALKGSLEDCINRHTMNPLSDHELVHLLEFVGYGELDAPIWFVGMEEAGGGDDNIRRRLKFKKVEDCAEAHRILGITKHHWGRKVYVLRAFGTKLSQN